MILEMTKYGRLRVYMDHEKCSLYVTHHGIIDVQCISCASVQYPVAPGILYDATHTHTY